MKLFDEAIKLADNALAREPDNIDAVRTLMSLYENVEMEDKYKELRAVYDAQK